MLHLAPLLLAHSFLEPNVQGNPDVPDTVSSPALDVTLPPPQELAPASLADSDLIVSAKTAMRLAARAAATAQLSPEIIARIAQARSLPTPTDSLTSPHTPAAQVLTRCPAYTLSHYAVSPTSASPTIPAAAVANAQREWERNSGLLLGSPTPAPISPSTSRVGTTPDHSMPQTTPPATKPKPKRRRAPHARTAKRAAKSAAQHDRGHLLEGEGDPTAEPAVERPDPEVVLLVHADLPSNADVSSDSLHFVSAAAHSSPALGTVPLPYDTSHSFNASSSLGLDLGVVPIGSIDDTEEVDTDVVLRDLLTDDGQSRLIAPHLRDPSLSQDCAAQALEWVSPPPAPRRSFSPLPPVHEPGLRVDTCATGSSLAPLQPFTSSKSYPTPTPRLRRESITLQPPYALSQRSERMCGLPFQYTKRGKRSQAVREQKRLQRNADDLGREHMCASCKLRERLAAYDCVAVFAFERDPDAVPGQRFGVKVRIVRKMGPPDFELVEYLYLSAHGATKKEVRLDACVKAVHLLRSKGLRAPDLDPTDSRQPQDSGVSPFDTHCALLTRDLAGFDDSALCSCAELRDRLMHQPRAEDAQPVQYEAELLDSAQLHEESGPHITISSSSPLQDIADDALIPKDPNPSDESATCQAHPPVDWDPNWQFLGVERDVSRENGDTRSVQGQELRWLGKRRPSPSRVGVHITRRTVSR